MSSISVVFSCTLSCLLLLFVLLYRSIWPSSADGYWFQVAQPGELKVKGPLPNVDVEIHRKLYSQFPVDSNVRKWTQKERESLIKGVRQQVQECRLRTAMEEFRYHSLGLSLSLLWISMHHQCMCFAMSDVVWSSGSLFSWFTSFLNCSFDNEAQDFNEWLRISGEREVTAEDIREALPLINWDEVAYRYVVDRLPSDCKIR
jgi:hypothetical protein